MAHRGGRGYWPENTLPAFQWAADLGVDALELDIHGTADGKLVVIHDDVLDGLTNGHGPIHRYTLAELQALDAGYCWTADGGATFPFRAQGFHIPTLEEILLSFHHLPINIDIKQAQPEIVPAFVALLERLDVVAQVVVGSFHHDSLQQFRRLRPDARTVASPPEVRLFFLLSRAFRRPPYRPPAYAYQVPETYGRLRLVTPRFVQAAHAQGLQVHIWTVNAPSDMQRLAAMGVDGFISDFPDRALQLLGRL